MQRRALARSLEPLPEESLPGFLLRLAYRLHRSPARVAHLCGLETNGQRRVAADHLLELPARTAAEFARVTGLSVPEVQALGLRRYTELFPILRTTRANTTHQSSRQGTCGSVSQFYESNWAVSLSTRFCPDCLSGDGSPIQEAYGGPWVLRWHLPFVFACTIHRRLLHSQCPACRSGLARSYKGRATLITQPGTTQVLHPLQCRNLFTRQDDEGAQPHPCGTRLDKSEGHLLAAMPEEDHQRLLGLQHRLDERLSPRRIDTERLQPSAVPTFQDLVHVAQLIKLSWPAGKSLVPSDALASVIDSHASHLHVALRTPRPRSSSRFSMLWAAPDNSAQCGALLVTAEEVLHSANDPAQLRAVIRPLARFAVEHAPGGACRSFFNRPGFSPTLARAMVRRAHGFHTAAHGSRPTCALPHATAGSAPRKSRPTCPRAGTTNTSPTLPTACPTATSIPSATCAAPRRSSSSKWPKEGPGSSVLRRWISPRVEPVAHLPSSAGSSERATCGNASRTSPSSWPDIGRQVRCAVRSAPRATVEEAA